MQADQAELQASGDRIEQLLAELERSAGPTTWPRVEELMRHVVGLYGAAIDRALSHALAAGARSDLLEARLREDPLLASLLVLHDLHPETLEQRVQRALASVRPMLAAHAGGVELLGIADGVVRLRLVGTCDGCPSSTVTLDHAVKAAILQAAPEIAAIVVDGATP